MTIEGRSANCMLQTESIKKPVIAGMTDTQKGQKKAESTNIQKQKQKNSKKLFLFQIKAVFLQSENKTITHSCYHHI